ncbi:MAG: DUF2723 domain-containing protein, partial [Anaerolineae bacterium]|nr:DUF2723 domain-containing protein [Anaerolineae bacterium]
SAEMQTLGYLLGIPHPTGYPVYIWLAKIFTYLPFGDIAYRVNLLSAVCSSIAIGLLYLIGVLALPAVLDRQIRRISAVGGALAVAHSYTLWSQSIIAEVYGLNAMLCALVAFLVLLWGRTRLIHLLYWAAAIWALGLGNHRSVAAMLPAIGIYLISMRSQEFTPGRITRIAAALVAAIALDMFLFYLLWGTHAPFDQFHRNVLTAADLFQKTPAELEGFWPSFWFVSTGQQASSMMFSADTAWQIQQLVLFPFRIIGEFFTPCAVLILIGFFVAWKEWRIQLFFFLWFSAQLFMNLNYSTWGIVVFYITIYLICGIWLAYGLAAVLHAFTQFLPFGVRSFASVCLIALICLLSPLTTRWLVPVLYGHPTGQSILASIGKRPTLKHQTQFLMQGRKIVDHLPANALVFGEWANQYQIEYVARVERNNHALDYYETIPYAPIKGRLSKYRLQLI